MSTLKVSNLTKNFGNTQVLKQINLEVVMVNLSYCSDLQAVENLLFSI